MKKTLSKAKNGKMVRTSAVDPEGNKIKQKTNTRTGVTKTVVKYSDPTSSGKRREVTREFSPKNLAVYKKNPKALEEDYGNKFKKGGAKKPLRKAQTGTNVDPEYTAWKKQQADAATKKRNTEFTPGQKGFMGSGMGKLDYNTWQMLAKSPANQYSKANPTSKDKYRTKDADGFYSVTTDPNESFGYPTEEQQNWQDAYSKQQNFENTLPKGMRETLSGYKKGGATKSMMKKGGALKKTAAKSGTMKKMKTGGMVNSNTKVTALKSAGSKGVKSGVNPKASASKKATGRSGGTSTAPKTATPKAKYGMMMKKKK